MSDVWQVLVDAGVDPVPVDRAHLRLRAGRRRATLTLVTRERPVGPGGFAALVERYGEAGLLVVPSATPGVRAAAEHAGWSLLINGPAGVTGVLRVGDAAVTIGAPARARARRTPGPTPWRSLTVIRRLIELPGANQTSLAAAAAISQPRVSQVLGPLTVRRLVDRSAGGWVVRDFDGLVRHWLDTYPGPGGISTHWYGLAPPQSQAEAVVRLLSKRRRHGSVVSGDVAADMLAPWASPTRAVVYARAGADLSAADLTPAGEAESTLELVVPADAGVWPSAGTDDGALDLADPLQILWDVGRSRAPDREEAVSRLWSHLRARSESAVAALIGTS
jgi:hypothetical protein